MVQDTTLQPTTTGKGKLVFTHLPALARFIRENHLIDYIRFQLKGARELNTPLLKIFGDMPDEQIIELSIPGHIQFLTAAEENKLAALLAESMEKWMDDRLDIVARDQIEAEDITQVSYLRKSALVHFLPMYTTDIAEILAVVQEIDTYVLETDTVGTNTYIDILKTRIELHTEALQERELQLLEAQKIADLGSFDWDLLTNKVRTSPRLLKVLDLERTGDFEFFLQKVHPADKAKVRAAMDEAYKTGDYECEYRLETNDGRERIIWSRGVVSFDTEGKPVNFRGTVMDVTEKHHMVQRLQRSEDLYKQAQALSHIGNWSRDLVYNRISWSDEMYRIYGLEPGMELNYDLALSFVHPDDRERVQVTVAKAIEAMQPYELYYRIIAIDDRPKILHARGEVLTDEGKAYKIVGTLQDVTERQNMLEQLQRSDYLYKQAQTLSHIGNWTWDMATNKVTWTDELYRIFGLEPGEEISFEKYLSLIHPDDKDMLMDYLQSTLKTHEPYDFYHRAITPDGSIKYLQSRGEVLLNEKGEPYQMMGTGQDVTRQQMMERKLREREEFIQKIANTTPSLIASYNVNTGMYTYINQALYTILGYETEEVDLRGVEFFIELIHPDDLPALIEKNTKALEEANNNPPPVDGNEMVVEFKYRMRHRNGEYHWFHTFGTIFDRDKNGKVEHLLNVSIDITEQEKAEQALQEKNIELQQSNASLEEYAYVASHDLKEPLRKIITFSDRLVHAQYDQLGENGRLYLDKIMDASRRMQTMISDLLSVSIISGNKAYEHADLKALLQEALQTLEYKIEEKNAVIDAGNLPVARVVPAQFRQLFLNLVGNSLKFVREDVQPQIKISHKYVQPAEVADMKLAKATRYLQIDISDNGIGFDNQFANKIFTIFQRLHGKTEYEGTGIGLAICRKIAENHGGTIVANGVINQGSTFTIIIPA